MKLQKNLQTFVFLNHQKNRNLYPHYLQKKKHTIEASYNCFSEFLIFQRTLVHLFLVLKDIFKHLIYTRSRFPHIFWKISKIMQFFKILDTFYGSTGRSFCAAPPSSPHTTNTTTTNKQLPSNFRFLLEISLRIAKLI